MAAPRAVMRPASVTGAAADPQAGLAPRSSATVPPMLPFRTGNLSVQRLHAARHGQPPPDPREERELLPYWRSLGFEAVEDYVAWQCCEPEPGAWDFTHHRANAQAAAHAGLQYVIYPWVHALPDWWRAGREHVCRLPVAELARGVRLHDVVDASRSAAEILLGRLDDLEAGYATERPE